MKSFDYLKGKGASFKEIHLSEVPRSAQDVERLYGCPLHQVLKTIVFIGDKGAIVVTLPGDRKASIRKLEAVTGVTGLRMAKPEEVLDATGYEVGGVTPFGAKDGVTLVMDKSVFDMDATNIGSGKAEIGIEMKSTALKSIWEGVIADIVQ